MRCVVSLAGTPAARSPGVAAHDAVNESGEDLINLAVGMTRTPGSVRFESRRDSQGRPIIAELGDVASASGVSTVRRPFEHAGPRAVLRVRLQETNLQRAERSRCSATQTQIALRSRAHEALQGCWPIASRDEPADATGTHSRPSTTCLLIRRASVLPAELVTHPT